MKRDNPKSGIDRKRLIRALITGVIVGTAVSVLILLLTAAVIVKSGRVPYAALAPAAIAAVCAGAFFGGYCCARINRSFGLAVGAVCGALMFPLILGLGAAFGGKIDLLSFLRCLLMILSAAAGGVLAVNHRRGA